jgi:murein DD-endopeptidase MepM/ murein hydrolase activator NlpD
MALRKLVGIGILAVGLIVLSPLTGIAQVDPCVPIPIPELCDVVNPSPSPSPSPSASPKGDKPNKTPKGEEEAASQEDEQGDKPGKKKEEELEQGATTPRGPLVISSPNNSATVVEVLTPLARYGLNIHEAMLRVAGPFPVAGLAYWTDDWGACRDGCSRSHEGLDIFGKEGTPLVAIADGVVTQKLVGETSGISVEIQDANGIQYFYAHMSAWAEPINVGDAVHMGQVLGYLGHTGNAIYTPPHLHLEYQPGGVPAPPKPHVDQWVKLAEIEARALAARVMGDAVTETSDFRLTRSFDLAGGAEILDSGAERILALAGIQPTVSSLEMARTLLGQMSWEIDWAGQTDVQLAALAQEASALSSAVDLSGATPWAPFGTAPAAGTTSTGVAVPEQGD